MAPKAAAKAPEPDAVDEMNRVTPPVFDEESLAAISFDGAEPFTDPEPQILPSSLEAVVASWQRPSEYLQSLLEEGAEPYVVKPPVEGTEEASRELPNLLEPVATAPAEESDAAAEARRALQWMVSCIQLVALHAGRVDEGCFLWELIHPQAEGRPRYSASGKYAVKLWEQGAWRLVTVDDKMPFDAAGASILPRSVRRRDPPHPHASAPPAHTPCTRPTTLTRRRAPPPPASARAQTAALELWPLLLGKAIYKLAAGSPSSLSQDPSVLLRLTGWQPQPLPISARLPVAQAWTSLHERLDSEACVLALTLPKEAEGDAALAEVGLMRGPLVAVRDAREVGGEHYVRVQTELMQARDLA